MSGRFVRSSKFRHVFGRPTRKDQCYDNLRISNNAWDTNLVKANPRYLSVNWEASGGGAFAVIPLDERGKFPERIPLFRGHTAAVLDTDWNPFNDSLVASGSDDGKVFLWRVPEGFTLRPSVEPDDIEDVAPVGKLSGHPKKVGHILFNPAAENILATASGDFTVKIWDIEAGAAKLSLRLGDIVQSQSWSANGSLLVTTSRDKKLRIWDVRQERPAHETSSHSGAKNSRAVWLGERDRIVTTGFSKMSDRQLALWDIRAPREPINGFRTLDSISGVCMPFWDEGTACLYLAGRGDGNIRYFELENDKFEFLAEYKSSDPQRGVAFIPKRGVNAHENEVARAYKTVNDTLIEPISFIVPRRSETFQDDIYPPTTGLAPAMGPSEWFSGKEAIPPKVSMGSLYDGEGLKEVTGVQDRPTESLSAPRPQPTSEPKPELKTAQLTPVSKTPEPLPAVRPAPSMKEQGASMAAMASKFTDKEEEVEAADDGSSFEEVQKPVEQSVRPTAVGSTGLKDSSLHQQEEQAAKPRPSTQPPPSSSRPSNTASTTGTVTPTMSTGPNMTTGASMAADAMQREVETIKAMITEQTKTIALQAQQMRALTEEIESLKAKLG